MCRKTAESVSLTKDEEGNLVIMDIESYNRREKMCSVIKEAAGLQLAYQVTIEYQSENRHLIAGGDFFVLARGVEVGLYFLSHLKFGTELLNWAWIKSEILMSKKILQ